MWTKEFLSEEQLAFYKLHPWYYQEFEKFSIHTKEIIESYKNGNLKNDNRLPPYIGISLTYKCNLHCQMCFQNDRTKYTNEITTKRLNEISDEIASWGNKPWITLWGGEPLLNRDFRNIYLQFQNSAGVLTVLTNGILLRYYFDLIGDMNFQTVWVVSIDGTEAIHDDIRGKKGSFRKTLDNLKEAVKIRERTKSKNVFGVQITITKKNIESISELCETLITIGVDWIVLNHLWFLNYVESENYKKELLDFDFLEVSKTISSDGFVLDNSLIPDPILVKKVIDECKQKSKHGTLIWSMPNYDSSETNSHYNKDKPQKQAISCYKNLVKMDIDVDGSVVGCKQFPDLTYGNITNNSLKTVWLNNLRFQMEDKIIDSQGLSICHMCPDKALSKAYQE